MSFVNLQLIVFSHDLCIRHFHDDHPAWRCPGIYYLLFTFLLEEEQAIQSFTGKIDFPDVPGQPESLSF